MIDSAKIPPRPSGCSEHRSIKFPVDYKDEVLYSIALSMLSRIKELEAFIADVCMAPEGLEHSSDQDKACELLNKEWL